MWELLLPLGESGGVLPPDRVWHLVGRLHVVAVHFPIALLVVGALMEAWGAIRLRKDASRVGTILLAIGAISAVVAAAMGWVHAAHGAYGGEAARTLAYHRWIGTVAAGIAVAVVVLRLFVRGNVTRLWIYRGGLGVTALLIGVVGHFGGTLTYGPGYLTLADLRASPTPALPAAQVERLDFHQHVLPILERSCIECHGDSVSRGALRLDTKAWAMKGGNAGASIIPGNSEASPLIRRIMGLDGKARMPKGEDPLPAGEVAILKQWIDAGAAWPEPGQEAIANAAGPQRKMFWAYEKPIRPAVPEVKDKAPVRNPVDAFLLARLEKEGLAFSPEAARTTLIRRLSLDLRGLPPAPEEVDAFVNDKSADAYETLVERMLSSIQHAERLAIHWLDQVRYADTIGYHSDLPQDVWPYRDWVINAFHANKPFDQFTVEQLAGDLLPGAALPQKVASTYNRLLQTTVEGGAQPKEYIIKYAADRVRNVSTAWMGATIGCAECHDHKYDPYTIKDFYTFAAFFADIKDPTPGSGSQAHLAGDTLVPTPEQATKLEEWTATLAQRRQALAAINLPEPPKEIRDLLKIEAARRNDDQKRKLVEHYRSISPEAEAAWTALVKAEAEHKAFLDTVPKTLATKTMTPRPTRILLRGNWLDDSGEVVTPAIPAFLPQLQVHGRPLNRLDLARWITGRDNPLTARVAVNRLWMLFYGTGLSKTVDDLGAQGEFPVHPELLDWLACEFMDSGWDVRHIVRLIVTSNAYRQSSAGSELLKEKDPYNRLIARQSPIRLDAEIVRDNALSIAGLLSLKVGGPSVKPYQPAGYWEHLNFPKRNYQHDKGESLYRRGLYTWWQRSFLNPSLLAFDAPTREEGACERGRSNIPQQALVLLNDPTYVEAARVFAEKIVAQGGGTAERLTWAYRRALGRLPSAQEVEVLTALLRKHREEYKADPESAKRLLKVGEMPAPTGDAVELAAWTSVARTILNLHEVITRQ